MLRIVEALGLMLHFFSAPTAPALVTDDCSVENNVVTLSWKPNQHSCVDGFVVEVDDGRGGPFMGVYRGNSLECTVTGLQFDSTYRARVRGYNKSGQGPPSNEIYLTTSDGKLGIKASPCVQTGGTTRHHISTLDFNGHAHEILI